MISFINTHALLDDVIVDNVSVQFERTIQAINKSSENTEDQVIDLSGNYLLPGFVDVHVHGAAGCDVMDGSQQALQTISQALAKAGVTRFLATTMTMPMADIKQAIDNVAQAMKRGDLTGAQPVGVHLEGPYISQVYCGAQNPQHIKQPKWSDIVEFGDVIKLITLAVEEDVDFEFIKQNPGIKLSIGHSSASFEQALAAYDLGVTHCTHCFNAMTGLHHRRPGVVGATFSKPYETEFIADGIHIHPGFLGSFVRIIGTEQAILITDSMRAGGMPAGKYELGGQAVTVDETSARLEDGRLAGSILTMDQAIRNMLTFTDYSLADIVKMASLNPAKSVGLDANYGSIAVGKAADFVVMDRHHQIVSTWRDGCCVYQRDKTV